MSPTHPILVAQIGSRRRYAVPEALYQQNLLCHFFTDITAGHPLVKLATCLQAAHHAGRRSKPEVPRTLITEFPCRFVASRLAAGARDASLASRVPLWIRNNTAFATAVASSNWRAATTAYAFNAAALEIFQVAESRGVRKVLDQTHAGWRSEFDTRQTEAQRWPGWEPPFPSTSTLQPLIEREEKEWALADFILCGSPYVVDQIATTPALRQKCRVLIPGRRLATPAPSKPAPLPGRLNVLYAGTLELRKGIQYVAEAARRLRSAPVAFRAVGTTHLLPNRLAELSQIIEIHGHATRETLEGHFHWADILLLPTLSEGSAGICTEALERGLPVVTTSQAGSPVFDGQNGFIIHAGSADGIIAVIERLLATPGLIADMHDYILRHRDELSLDHYGLALANLLSPSHD